MMVQNQAQDLMLQVIRMAAAVDTTRMPDYSWREDQADHLAEAEALGKLNAHRKESGAASFSGLLLEQAHFALSSEEPGLLLDRLTALTALIFRRVVEISIREEPAITFFDKPTP